MVRKQYTRHGIFSPSATVYTSKLAHRINSHAMVNAEALAEQAVHIRCFGELKDFLPKIRQGRRFILAVKGVSSIKDTLESVGIPHVAIGKMVVNRVERGFSYQVKGGDDISVYPYGGRPLPPGQIRFILDVHLEKLARLLRLLGFDIFYENNVSDDGVIELAKSKRVVLTRDIGILKHKRLRWGYWVRSVEPRRQLMEVIRRYDLWKAISPFSRCVECNGWIKPVAKADIAGQLPPKTRQYYRKFYRCGSCRRIYWRGSHYQKMLTVVERLKKKK